MRAFITDHIIAKGTCMAQSIIHHPCFSYRCWNEYFSFSFPCKHIFDILQLTNQTIIIFFWINTSLFSLCYVFIRILAIIWLHNIKDFLIDRNIEGEVSTIELYKLTFKHTKWVQIIEGFIKNWFWRWR